MFLLNFKSKGSELVKITLVDLLFKKILNAHQEDVEINSRFSKKTRTSTKTFICMGEKFYSDLKPHEDIFRHVIQENGKLEISHLAQKINQKMDFNHFRDDLIRKNLLETGFLELKKKKILALIPNSNYELTEYGESILKKIQKNLDKSEMLDYWVENEPERAKAYILGAGTNILLFPGHDLLKISQFSKKLAGVNVDSKSFRTYGYYWYPTVILFDGYHNLNDLDGDFDINILGMDFLDNINSFDDISSDFDSVFDGGSFDGGCDGGDGGGE